MRGLFEKLIEKLDMEITDTYYKSVEGNVAAGIENNIYHNIKKFVMQLVKEYNDGWTLLTDDEESYPTPLEYVLVEDEYGNKNVACCYPDYDWHISNGENSLKLNGNVVKWKKISD